ncbi:hypothetical protein IMSAG025_00177 [Muribaculaceae bacterium]|nr:hypothetical protein IMSAG025_00177 [Muribaculaceae bacterium]
MTSAAERTFRECGSHLRRGICSEQIDIPLLLYAVAEKVEGEILFSETFTDTDDPSYA